MELLSITASACVLNNFMTTLIIASEFIPVPDDSCTITWDEFTNKVVNRTWASIYVIDNDAEINLDTPDTPKFRWTILEDGTVQRLASQRNIVANSCISATGTFKKHDCVQNAVFEAQPGDLFYIPGRKDYFLSDNLDKYLIWHICHTQQNNVCTNSVTFIMIPDMRPDTDGDGQPDGHLQLNCIPWCSLDSFITSCLGKSFSDETSPIIQWSWNGEECPLVQLHEPNEDESSSQSMDSNTGHSSQSMD